MTVKQSSPHCLLWLCQIHGKWCLEAGEIHRVAITRGSILFQNQMSLPSQYSGTTRSNKASSWGLLLSRSTSFPHFFLPLAGAALCSLSGNIDVSFFVFFCDSHLALLSAKFEEKSNKTKQNKNPRSWSSFPKAVHRERNRESTQECAAVCKGKEGLQEASA